MILLGHRVVAVVERVVAFHKPCAWTGSCCQNVIFFYKSWIEKDFYFNKLWGNASVTKSCHSGPSWWWNSKSQNKNWDGTDQSSLMTLQSSSSDEEKKEADWINNNNNMWNSSNKCRCSSRFTTTTTKIQQDWCMEIFQTVTLTF